MKLVNVVPQLRASYAPYGSIDVSPATCEADKQEAQRYLDQVAGQQSVDVHTRAVVGGVIDCLTEAVDYLSITDIVMVSHGRTGLPRVILGSVADALLHRLTCPIVIIPSVAARHIELTAWTAKRTAPVTQ